MKRISWHRFKGEQLPPNTVRVDRSSKYGNPYKLSEYSRGEALRLYGIWLDSQLKGNPDFLLPLVGKNIACSCRLTDNCHADLIIEKMKQLYPGEQ